MSATGCIVAARTIADWFIVPMFYGRAWVGWGVENYGTDPTIDVDYTPQDYARGFDPQLERGIAEAQRLIEEYPAATPKPGQHPYRGYPKP